MIVKSYEESYLPLANFLSRIEVYCPSCGKRGCIRTDLPPISAQKKIINVFVDGFMPSGNYEWKKAKFTCFSCPKVIEFDQKNPLNTWYGKIRGTAKTICAACAKIGYKERLIYEFFTKKNDLNPLKSQPIKLECPKCHASTAAEVGFTPFFDVGMLIDPIFGLSLFLSKTIGRNTIWAYNKEHLNHIKYFVQASQRKIVFKVETPYIRIDMNRAYISMAQSFSQTLPAWIKKKSNRDNILKTISQMEKTF